MINIVVRLVYDKFCCKKKHSECNWWNEMAFCGDGQRDLYYDIVMQNNDFSSD